MAQLKKQAEWCARVQWTLAIVLSVVAASFAAVVQRPNGQKLTALKEQIDEKTRDLQSNRARVAILPDVLLAVNEKRERLEKFDKKLPKQPEIGPFMNDITEISHQTSLRRMEFNPGTPTFNDTYAEWPIAMKFDGDFASVFAFLRRAEEMQRLTRIKGLKVRSPDSGKTGQVQVDLSMNIYFSKEG